MKILITGATGFIGSTLVPYLYSHGLEDITLLVRDEQRALTKFSGLTVGLISTNNTGWNEQIISLNPDIVIHLATFFTGMSDADHVESIIESNVLFTTLLLESLSYTNCTSFINTGTFTEFCYGNGEYFSNNLYSASKTAVRPIIRYFQTRSTWNWINLIVYTPYGRRNEHKKVIDYMIDAVGAPNPVPFTKGEQILDFIHVDDIADFFYTLIRKLPYLNNPFYEFHLGTGIGHSLREMGDIIERVWQKKLNADWGKREYSLSDVMYAVAPICRNLELLDWRSRISIEEGIIILFDDLNQSMKWKTK